ncbi:alpha,alpha-trehalose-phosphate synthase [Chloropicon primus]|uniref:alpha,alpha-trehalose-phosphate synthase (UDP-forming) n=1 Tax=Chloropicon primus TaxID=1764295 RepID=A0A5B8MUH7_9CHLO|nr:glycosyltransferase [Chloropicon primus]UPR03437.1 alpha,alpha-trehalose-phosphate synthase [Chloropicon primus]|eukprot:QDZ24229.1 glycosyltransferase [Chloropicon primus]
MNEEGGEEGGEGGTPVIYRIGENQAAEMPPPPLPPQQQQQATTSHVGPFSNVSTRVDRLLRERQMRRSQSLGTLQNAAKREGGGGGGGGVGKDAASPGEGATSLNRRNSGSGNEGMEGGLASGSGGTSAYLGAERGSTSPLKASPSKRRQSDSDSISLSHRLNNQVGMGMVGAGGAGSSTNLAELSQLPLRTRSKSPMNLGGLAPKIGQRDALNFAPQKNSDSSLLGDWRNFSADKLVLLGQETMNNELVKDKGMRISGPGPLPMAVDPAHGVGVDPAQAQALSGMMDSGKEQRLIIVANRLPFSAFKGLAGDWKLQVSPGGLVSALTCVEGYSLTWVGWPGQFIEETERESLKEAFGKKDCCPVYLDADTTDLFYNGYCNSILWQLFHYIALQQEGTLSETETVQDQYEAYKRANEEFMKAVMSQYQEGDIVWVHDYHLMLLPALLKEEMPDMKVGWFLHTPFPSSEIFRTLPQRDDILMGVLRADLVGFHTYDYARHFVSSCCRILGLEGTLDGIENAHMGTITRVAVFPIGIDPDKWINELDTPSVQARILEMRGQFSGRKVLLGVDRLDMVKGIPQKLLAFEKFLEENPEWRSHVLLVQIAVPSRKDVPEYQKLTSGVHEMVGRINGRFGSLTQNPIHFLDCSLDFHNLCALYSVTDVLVVSSLRDGMNLVSYEFVACQSKESPGVLVLSEFAGAAQSLGAGAILSNPYNVNELSNAIAYALKMSDGERQQRHRQNFMHVKVHTAQAWGETFISELHDTHIEAALRTMHIPPKLNIFTLADHYRTSKSRLIVMGYNATLTTSANPKAQANHHHKFDQIRTLTQISEEVKSYLSSIVSQPDTEVLVVSGSERYKLERIFEGVNVWLAAENGIFLKPPFKEWELVLENVNLEWMESVQLVFDYFCERTPRSYVDTRETSLVWNCKYADIDFGRNQMRDMLQHLWTGSISNAQVEILRGAKSVEARPLGVTKGGTVQRIIQAISQATSIKPDFILCAGHFMHRDEDLFSYFDKPTEEFAEGLPTLAATFGGCPKHITTCTVGRKHSLAKHHLKSSLDIADLLGLFVKNHS